MTEVRYTSERGARTGEANALAADAKYRARISEEEEEEEEERHIIIALYLAIKCGRPTHSTLSRRARVVRALERRGTE